MSTDSTATSVLAGLTEVRTWQEDFYRNLHQHPELSHQEGHTAEAAAQRLRGLGFEVHEGVGGTGVVAVLRNGAGPSVMLRADMDALPVREQTGLPYASTVTATDHNGTDVPVMHACGHDVHVTCLLGAAALLAGAPTHWTGTVIALLQPAEELGDGAARMVADGLGALVGDVDVALAQHVPPFPAGSVATRPGPVLSAADSMRITVYGRGSHGSMPQASVDPVVLAAMVVIRLQTVVSREISPTEPAVLTVGSVRAGTKSNVIDDHAILELNIRSYDDQTRTNILDAVRRIVVAECQASGSPSEPEFELFDRFPADQQRPGQHRAGACRFRCLLRGARWRPAAAERERRFQRPAQRVGDPLHVLGNRRYRSEDLSGGRSSRTGLPGHPDQPLAVLRSRTATHPRHRNRGTRHCGAGLAPIVLTAPKAAARSYTAAMSDSAWSSSMPEIYDRCLGGVVFGPYAAELAQRTAALSPNTVLELAAGTGVVTAELVRALPGAAITATDLNPPMVEYARARVTGPTWDVADAQNLPYADRSYDVVVCQFGVMFLPDRVAAYRGVRRVLAPGGTFLFNAWDTLETNAVESAVIDVMAELFPQSPPDFLRRTPHGYADATRIRSDVEAAGFDTVQVQRIALTGHAESAQSLAEGYCLGTPLRFELAERADPADVVQPLADALTERFGAGPVAVPMSAHVVTAARTSD